MNALSKQALKDEIEYLYWTLKRLVDSLDKPENCLDFEPALEDARMTLEGVKETHKMPDNDPRFE